MAAALAPSVQPDASAAKLTRGAGARILLVENDEALARLIQRQLGQHNFWLERVASATDARAHVDRFRPDLVLLDMDTGSSNGFDLIGEIRRYAAPIIVMSTRRAERDEVAALERGADDFLGKPLGVRELLARVRVALRHVARPESGADAVVRAGSLQIDLERRRVLRAGLPIHLTPTEYQLLKVLATHPDSFLSDRWLMEKVWGASRRSGEHSLHVYVARLRKKIEDDPAAPRYVVTESGLGYSFTPARAARRI